jgi:hypothetical protein
MLSHTDIGSPMDLSPYPLLHEESIMELKPEIIYNITMIAYIKTQP